MGPPPENMPMSVTSSRLLAVAAVFALAADLAMPAGFAALSAGNQAARQGGRT
jgi:hypothetical protein